MYKHILLAVDGSEAAKKAATHAGGIATDEGAQVLVVHIREVGWGGRSGAVSFEPPEEALDLVNGVVHELRERGVDAHGKARSALLGRVAPEILSVAADTQTDLIVMGSRGLSDFAGLLLGSVAHKVIHHAECPVLVVR